MKWTPLVSLAAIVTLASVQISHAQSLATDVTPEAGIVRFKVDRHYDQEYFHRSVEELLSTERVQASVEPWLDREMLFFPLRGGVLFFRALESRLGTESPIFSLARIYTARFDRDLQVDKICYQLETLEGVEYAEPVSPVYPAYLPDDPMVIDGSQWHHDVIGTPDVWEIARGDSSVVVAITDTGFELTHEDIKGQIWYNPGEGGELASNGMDDDGNGLVDDWRGYDFGGVDGGGEDNDPTSQNDLHGNHVAGIAGATGENGLGGAGVAYGVKLMLVKLGGDGNRPKLPGAFDGLLYAASMGADVINCSWGTTTYSRSEQEFVRYVRQDLGILIVAAAGNAGTESAYYPASYKHVLSVASTRQNDSKASTSNYHHTVDLSAPGDGILSTVLQNRYATESGTSMATPMVSATAALLLSTDPDLSADELEYAIRANSLDVSFRNPQYLGKLGNGRLDVSSTLADFGDTKAAAIVDAKMLDDSGDGYVDAGEGARLVVEVKNILSPLENATLTVEPENEALVTVIDGVIDLGPMTSGEVLSSPDDKFVLEFPEDSQPNTRIGIWVTLESDDFVDRRFFEFDIYLTWGTTSLNDIAASFNGIGNIAFNGLDRDQGDGFYYKGNGSLIYHGGLLLGRSEATLADVVRRGSSSLGTNEGFRLAEPYRTVRTDQSLEVGSAAFVVRADTNVLINMKTYEREEDPSTLLVTYEIVNGTDRDLDGMYCGLFLDWDIIRNGSFDQVLLDETEKLGFVRNSREVDVTAGAALVSPHPLNYRAIENLDEGITVSFPDAKKWEWMSGGILRETTEIDIDGSMIISAGPFSVPTGASELIAFALVVSEDHPGLRESVERARIQYNSLTSVPYGNQIAGVITYPHPSAGRFTISFPQPLPAGVSMEIFDPIGRKVSGWSSERLDEKSLLVRLDGISAGVYTVRTRVGEQIDSRQIVVQP